MGYSFVYQHQHKGDVMSCSFLSVLKNVVLSLTILLSVLSQASAAEKKTQFAGYKKEKKEKRIAICYWGLTRSTKKVYASHYKHLFDILTNKGFKYDVFMHTWNTKSKQRIWNKEIDQPIDYDEYKLLNPKFYRIDDQDEFTDNLEFDKYFYDGIDGNLENPDNGDWWPELSEKLILNHLCALESLKRVTEMVESSRKKYDLVMYVRPDVRLKNKFPTNVFSKVVDGDIIIPDFDHYSGYNDRFAVLNFKTASLYGKRIDGLAEFRRSKGHITSERYVKYVCDINHLNVILVPFRFDIVRP